MGFIKDAIFGKKKSKYKPAPYEKEMRELQYNYAKDNLKPIEEIINMEESPSAMIDRLLNEGYGSEEYFGGGEAGRRDGGAVVSRGGGMGSPWKGPAGGGGGPGLREILGTVQGQGGAIAGKVGGVGDSSGGGGGGPRSALMDAYLNMNRGPQTWGGGSAYQGKEYDGRQAYTQGEAYDGLEKHIGTEYEAGPSFEGRTLYEDGQAPTLYQDGQAPTYYEGDAPTFFNEEGMTGRGSFDKAISRMNAGYGSGNQEGDGNFGSFFKDYNDYDGDVTGLGSFARKQSEVFGDNLQRQAQEQFGREGSNLGGSGLLSSSAMGNLAQNIQRDTANQQGMFDLGATKDALQMFAGEGNRNNNLNAQADTNLLGFGLQDFQGAQNRGLSDFDSSQNRALKDFGDSQNRALTDFRDNEQNRFDAWDADANRDFQGWDRNEQRGLDAWDAFENRGVGVWDAHEGRKLDAWDKDEQRGLDAWNLNEGRNFNAWNAGQSRDLQSFLAGQQGFDNRQSNLYNSLFNNQQRNKEFHTGLRMVPVDIMGRGAQGGGVGTDSSPGLLPTLFGAGWQPLRPKDPNEE